MVEKRTKLRHVLFTESEIEEIEKFANKSGLTQSQFIREAILKKN
ncbi:MAG: ribbon-helix-helix protein, CopG family [Promethearchaeota archaeon]